ncbi:DUF4388 domain-containing protein [bacterium]|nr:DUF4388 domain-containing protein [bacterium]
MKKDWLQGNLKDFPFSFLLFRIWQYGLWGRLNLPNSEGGFPVFFQNGNIILESGSFPQEEFMNDLVSQEAIFPSTLKKTQKWAAQQNSSLIKALMELEGMEPASLWEHMETFYRKRLYPLFEMSSGSYSVHTHETPSQFTTLFSLSTLHLIDQGVRRMNNFHLIQSHLPPENKTMRVFSPSHLRQLRLQPPEKYIFRMIESGENLNSLYQQSELGKKKTQKILFWGLSLGLVGLHPPRQARISNLNFSASQLEEILNGFNTQCAYIYKYMSKKIGPVSLNILRKSLQKAKTRLPSIFQRVELNEDGKMNVKPILKSNVSLSNDKTKTEILKGLNELLAAELLCVKKTLGKEHESILVKNLNKIRE